MTKLSILRTDVPAARALAAVPAPVARRVPTPANAACDAWLKLLPAARRVLQAGDDAGLLGAAYRRHHAGCDWQHVVNDVTALPADLELIVLVDGWERTHEPGALLERLGASAAPGCRLFVAMQNHARLALLEQFAEGDLSDDGGPLSQPHLRHASPASLSKLLLDAGWLPALVASTPTPEHDARVLAAALLLADTLGIPPATARQRLCTGRFVLEAVRDAAPAARLAGPARFSVVVPTNRENQLRLNVLQSPGLREVGARVVAQRHASSPAAALAAALPQLDADWVLLCHQDIYFPRGFGEQLNAVLAGIAPADRPRTLIGFAGMGVDIESGTYRNAGFVIDRGHRFDHPASLSAVSIDELAIVVARESLHRIDPAMGWHLWATELCLAAICTHRVFPQIVHLPLFHNSVNDYCLPEAFHESGRKLADKYPDFGPIHTLCGVIQNAPRHAAAAATPDPAAWQPTLEGRGAELPAADAAIGFALQAGEFEQALQLVAAGVHRHYRLPAVTNRLLYYPGMDRRLEELAARLAAAFPLAPATSAPRRQLLIATELYALGGHTRVLADMAAELERPTIVLTDLFRAVEQDPKPLQALKALFPHADLRLLPPGTHWQKCAALRRLAAELNPRDIVCLGHHQDPIPFVATLLAAAPNKVFVHHGDHNPSLGCTLPGWHHVDLSDGVREICAAHLDGPVATLPLYVDDRGVKVFPAPQVEDCSAVTSGHPDKFARNGALALQQIVCTTLRTLGGEHIHIGPLPADWLGEIHAAIAAEGMDPARFVSVGWVASLWERLKTLDAALYIGSAPLGGGRAAVEAQGCGYPVLYHAAPDAVVLSTNHPLYAERALAWATPADLADRLRLGVAQHARLSAAARALYEHTFSRTQFRQALAQILAPR